MQDLYNYQFLKNLQKLPFVKSLILYGSRARGEANSRADIDLAVLCPNATSEDWSKIMTIINEDSDTLLKIDCVRLDSLPDSSPLKANIIREGKVLYQHD